MDYRRLIFVFALCGLLGLPAMAESAADSVYISDILRVGVRPEPDSRVTPVGVVTTGMKLEVIDSVEGYLKIRTDKGLTGWIKDIYATEEPPAMIRLEQLQAKRENTLKELEELRESVKALEEANQLLTSQLDEVKAERSKLQLRLARDTYQQKQNGSYRIIWLVALLLVGGGAFAGGVAWQRHKTRQRLGGLKL